MSDLTAVPQAISAAATDVAAVGSSVNAAHTVAAASTVAVLPAAADEVSAGIAQLFSGFAQDYHALAAQASAFQQQFVQHLHASAASYSSAETVNAASLLQEFEAAINGIVAAPGQILGEASGMFKFISSFFTLSAEVVYELALFGYLTLAILIGLEEIALKYAGIVIPIP